VLEGAEAVEHKGFGGRLFGSSLFMKEQTMPPESLGKSLNRAVGNFELSGDLAKA
jgi:hypothetical protein